MDRPTIRLTITLPDVAATIFLDATLAPHDHWRYATPSHGQPSVDALKALPAGCVVTLAMTGTVQATLVWTTETFKGLHNTYKLQSSFSDTAINLDFSQRCYFSKTGYASWGLILSTTQLQYRLSCLPSLGEVTGGPTPDPNPTAHPDISLRNLSFIVSDGENPTKSNFFGALGDGPIVAELRPETGVLSYRPSDVDLPSTPLDFGNGIRLNSDDKALIQFWQSCSYQFSSNSKRTVELHLDGMSSRSVLRTWTDHVATRYYEGLALNHAFTLLPELALPVDADDTKQPLWSATLSITDSVSLGSSNPNNDLKWYWHVQDSTAQFPDNYLSEDMQDATTVVSTRVLSVRIPEHQVAPRAQMPVVVAKLGAFLSQDGKPVFLDKLKLDSPPQKPNTDDRTAWKFSLKGYVDPSATTSLTAEPVSGLAMEQVVRAGGFALHLLPASPGVGSPYALNVTADFGLTSNRPAPAPVMPVISCNLSPMGIWDAAPAGEDELNRNQYAQLNIGSPSQNAASSIAKLLDEIYNNMQRDVSVVFRRPTPKPQPIADGSWALQYREQSSLTEKQYVSMQLLFTPHGDATDKNYESVFVLSRNPYSFADVHFHPLTSRQGGNQTKVADWNSVSNEWRILELNTTPSYMVLPSQVVAEETVTSDDVSPPQGLGDGNPTRMALGSPTVITYASDPRTNAVKLPWDLQRLTTDASLAVSRIDYEMLYGMPAATNADHMRLTEAATLYGDLLGEFPRMDVPERNPLDPQWVLSMRYLLAQLHWSRVHREYRSRLGVFVVQDSSSADPESFTDTKHTIARLRLDTPYVNSDPPTTVDDFMGPSLVPSAPPPADVTDKSFKGGALSGVADENIYKAIVASPKAGLGSAAVIDPRFSAVGGFGTTRGSFNGDKSALINTISMGRTVNYTVEQVGRIGCHWNRAKHVIVYERTVVPSRQFYKAQSHVAYQGLPLVRKVEEYVEFTQPERIFSEESAVPQAAFAHGFKCGDRKRISVDSAWGVVVPGQGWKVPLWNAAASALLPDVYPKPQLYLEITSPEQALDSTDQQPHYLTADALLTHPEEVFFYTSYVEKDADTDNWRPVDTVDRVGYPMLAPDAGVYDGGDLTAVPLPEFPTPPGWEPVTFRITPPAAGIHATAGVVNTRTPMAAQLTRVTVARGSRPGQTTTVRELLGRNSSDTTPSNNYVGTAASPGVAYLLAAIPQAFAGMRAAIKAELASPNPQTKDALLKFIGDIQTASAAPPPAPAVASPNNITAKLQSIAGDMSTRFTKPYTDAAAKLQPQIKANCDKVLVVLTQLRKDLANPGAVVQTLLKAQISHVQQTFAATAIEVNQWTAIETVKLDVIVRRWSNEIETALVVYGVQLNSPIGTLSPLRPVCIAFKDFKAAIEGLQKPIEDALIAMPGSSATLTQTRAFATRLSDDARTWSSAFDSALSQLTRALTNLQHAVQQLDSSLVLVVFHTSGVAAHLQTLVDNVFQAVSTQAPGAVNDALAALQKALLPVKDSLVALDGLLTGIDNNLNTVNGYLHENSLDLIRGLSVVDQLYAPGLSLQKLKDTVKDICSDPTMLLAPYIGNPPACPVLQNLADETSTALKNFASLLTTWIAQQAPVVFTLPNSVASSLQSLVQQLKGAVAVDFAAVQTQLDAAAAQYHGVVQQASQYVDHYVRVPLVAAYQGIAPDADKAMRVLRAFGAPPQVPHLDVQPAVVGYLYDGIAARVPVTPMLARANQAGQILNALGVHLPTVSLSDAMIPASLRNFQLTDVLPNFAGLRLPGLFAGIKLPDIDNRSITVTHGWEPQSRRAWLQAEVNVPFTQRMTVFNAGFLSFVLTNATFAAQSRIQTNGSGVQQSTHGRITGTWNIEIGDSNALISFASTTLAFDEHGKFQFLFKPEQLTLSDALKAITALVQSFSDPTSGFTYGATPTGVKCAFALPIPDTAALTSGFSGLKFSTSLALDFADDFKVILAIGVSSKDRPFNFAIFILGGCGYLTAGVVYNISKRRFDPPTLEMAIGVSASLAIALGPISGGVYAQFAIELRNSGSGFRMGAFFQISGHVSICGILSVDIVFRLEATYGNGVMIATGHFSLTVHLFMFSFSISRDVSMQMGSGGQNRSLLEAPPPYADRFARPPGNLVASLAGPDGLPAGLADAFFADVPIISQSLGTRYVRLLI